MSQIKKLSLGELPACPVETTLTLINAMWNWGTNYKKRLAESAA